jgi:SAM-dependent methyltransferase
MTTDDAWGDDYGGANASGWQRVAHALGRRCRGLGRWVGSLGRERWPIETLATRLANSIGERLGDARPLAEDERNSLRDLQPLLARIGWRRLLPAVAARLSEDAQAAASPCRNIARWHAWAKRIEQAIAQVESSFQNGDDTLPERIHPEDGRLLCVIDWIEGLKATRKRLRVADVGCGSGRFLKVLSQRFPDVEFIGIDPAPPGKSGRRVDLHIERGSLPDLPWDTASFDGAFTVETLEHCLFPQAAVRELARIIRPEGGLLIVDKYRRQQWLSDHKPWEQWFWPSDLSRPLSQHCRAVDCRFLTHGPPGLARRNLFLAWRGCGTRQWNGSGQQSGKSLDRGAVPLY